MPSVNPNDVNALIGTIQQPLTPLGPPNTLSICMIVKNEEKNIEAAVRSFIPFADEIIVNDTGSTDKTLDILKQLPVTIIQSEWIGDFSYSRNLSIEAATQSWILWMDADDRVPAGQIENFNKLKTAPLDRMFGFQIINTQAGLALGTRFMQTRMFPRHPKIRFERAVHEQMIFSGAQMGLYSFFTETTIHHTGYEDPETKKLKAQRNLDLLENDVDIDIDPIISMQLGDSYAIIGELDKSIEAYKHSFSIPHCREINADCYNDLPTCIGRSYQLKGNLEAAKEWFLKGIELNPKKLESYYYLAESYLKLGDTPTAENYLIQVAGMDILHTGTSNQFDVIKMYSYFHLCKLYTTQQKFDRVIAWATRLKEEYPEVIESRIFLGKSHLSCNRIDEAIGWLEDAVQRNPKADETAWQALCIAYEQKDDRIALANAQGRYQQTFPKSTQATTHDSSIDVSVCMIVKDEESTLPHLLHSIAGLWDELIIVDTGSGDRTPAIIEEFGGELRTAPWEGDFAKARNISLEGARGRWIVWFDADDIVLPEDRVRLKQLLSGSADKAYGVMVKNSTDGGKTGSVFNQIRVFPNKPEVRFTGKVHEQVLPALDKLKISVEFTTIKVIHTGYIDDAIVADKQHRNLSIMQQELEEYPQSETVVKLYSIAGAYQDLKNFEKALEWYQKALERANLTSEDPHIREMCPVKIAACYAELGDLNTARRVIESAAEQAPHMAEALLIKAQVLSALGETESAVIQYVNLFYFQEQPTLVPVDYQQIKIKACAFLGDYWNKKNNQPLAVAILRIGVALRDGELISSEKLLSFLFDAEEYTLCKHVLTFGLTLNETADLYLNLGKASIMLNDVEDALMYLKKGTEKYPSDLEIIELLKALHADVGQ
ncbi:MAG: glycosyltransferase [Fibrobacterales bacterium]